MSKRSNNILIVSRSSAAVDALHGHLSADGRDEVATRVMTNGHADPLHNVSVVPDVLILRVDEATTAELDEFIARPANQRCPLIVVGNSQETSWMRLAMQAGARDFLLEPVSSEALIAAVDQIIEEKTTQNGTSGGQMVAFVNAKGGVGSSFLAANFAHVCQDTGQLNTVLVDLDRQFTALPQYLDVKIQRGLSEAFEVAHELDSVAIEAFLSEHPSGLRLLGERHDFFIHFGVIESAPHRVEQLLGVLSLLDAKFDRIVVDVPRNLDALGIATLERADHIVLVVQQSVPCIRDAARMKTILTQNLNIESERLKVLVNRYQSNAPASLDDIKTALNVRSPILIPNHFSSVSRSIDTGVPIADEAPNSPVTKALRLMADELNGEVTQPPKNIFSRSISAILRS